MRRIRFSILAIAIALVLPATAAADARVIVKYRKGASPVKRRSSIESIAGRVLGVVRGQGTRLVSVTGDPVRAAASIARKPGVAWAEPDYPLNALGAPNDPLLSQLGGLGLMHA